MLTMNQFPVAKAFIKEKFLGNQLIRSNEVMKSINRNRHRC